MWVQGCQLDYDDIYGKSFDYNKLLTEDYFAPEHLRKSQRKTLKREMSINTSENIVSSRKNPDWAIENLVANTHIKPYPIHCKRECIPR